MTKQTQDSGFFQRVHRGHFENFCRKLTAAESHVQLEKIISTIDVAITRKMIDSSDHESLMELIQRRRQELNKADPAK